jgi:predicted dehydrogenase
MSSSARVAIIGAGYTAREHARAFHGAAPGCLVGIHSRSRPRAEALAADFSTAAYASIEELLERQKPTLVVVCVNEPSQLAVIETLARFPGVLLTEKPLGATLAEARHLAALLAERRARGAGGAFVALNRRTIAVTAHVRAALGAEGAERFIKIQDQQNLERMRALGKPDAVLAHWAHANSIHVIDYLSQFARGPLVDCNPVVSFRPDTPGPVVVHLRFASGDQALYEGIWHGPGPWAVTVTTRDRRWELRPLESATTQALGQGMTPVPSHPWDNEFKPGFRLQAELALAEASGDPSAALLAAPAELRATSLATVEQALASAELVARILPTPA